MVHSADAVRPSGSLSDQALVLRLEQPKDHAAVAALIAKAFGPGRFAKTAERLRENNTPRFDLSFVAMQGERLAGSVRLWPIVVGGEPLVFLGPFAVDPALRSHGLGTMLIDAACKAAKAAGEQAVLLVGDLAYFAKLGFEAVDASKIKLPGPVDARRLLIRRLTGDAPDYNGMVGARSVLSKNA
jgi:predicted N-acetyltransferase YhbS